MQESGLFIWEIKKEPDYKGLWVFAKGFLLYSVSNRETLEVFKQSTKTIRKIIEWQCFRCIGMRRGQRHTSWKWLIWTDRVRSTVQGWGYATFKF